MLLRVADLERSTAFYRDVLGFRVAERDPEHGGVFMTLGDDFHTVDLFPHPDPANADSPTRSHLGVAHIAFQVGSFEDLRDAYATLQSRGVDIDRAMDLVNQLSIYFADPDGNRLEIYYEVSGALARWPDGRGDADQELPVTRPDQPLPAWLSERWG